MALLSWLEQEERTTAGRNRMLTIRALTAAAAPWTRQPHLDVQQRERPAAVCGRAAVSPARVRSRITARSRGPRCQGDATTVA